MPSLNCTNCRVRNVHHTLGGNGPIAQRLREELGLCTPCISTRLKYRIESVSRDDFIEKLEGSTLTHRTLRADTNLYYHGNRFLRPDLLVVIEEIEGSDCKLVVDTEWDEFLHRGNTAEGDYTRTEK